MGDQIRPRLLFQLREVDEGGRGCFRGYRQDRGDDHQGQRSPGDGSSDQRRRTRRYLWAAQTPLLTTLAGLLESKQATTVSPWPETALPRIKLAQGVIVGLRGDTDISRCGRGLEFSIVKTLNGIIPIHKKNQPQGR